MSGLYLIFWFSCSQCTEKPGKPNPPEIGVTTTNSISLSWQPPADDGGAEITNYIVEYRAESASKWITANKDIVAALSYKVTGLKKDMVYEFRISAVNKAGTGPASDPSKPAAAKEAVCKHFSLEFSSRSVA